MRVDLSTCQAAGFAFPQEQADVSANNFKWLDAGASPTLTPQSSCGELESCDDDASATGKGRPLPAWLQNGASTTRASRGSGRATACRGPVTSRPSVPAPVQLARKVPPTMDRLAALRARGETVRTTMAFEPPIADRRSQRRMHTANVLPSPHQQDFYGLHHQASLYSEHQMNAMQAYATLLQEEAGHAMYGATAEEAVTYAAFQQGFFYGCDLQSDAVDHARPMNINVDGLSTLAKEEVMSAAGAGVPLTFAPPPGL